MNPHRQNLTVLGSTGSIGQSTLAVVAQYPEQFQIFALTAHTQVDKLLAQCLRFQPRFAVLGSETAAASLRQQLPPECPTEVLSGTQALIDVASVADVDVVMAAIVGVAGLAPTWAAVEQGKRILLANKETLVVAGGLFMNRACECGAQILPVDSEHNAIFQSLPHDYDRNRPDRSGVESIILTASGGPFWNKPAADFAAITPAQAVAHPNWSMGQKISVDSATMMNKGLEVIEAFWLFGLAADCIEVLVHPQSIIHSMVRYADGSVLAQLGSPDMRTPIACALSYPNRIKTQVKKLDFCAMGDLTFCPPDMEKFPCLQLAFSVLQTGADAPCVLNAANEEAVAAFLAGRIGFTQIPMVVESALTRIDLTASNDLAGLLDKDIRTREYVWQLMN